MGHFFNTRKGTEEIIISKQTATAARRWIERWPDFGVLLLQQEGGLVTAKITQNWAHRGSTDLRIKLRDGSEKIWKLPDLLDVVRWYHTGEDRPPRNSSVPRRFSIEDITWVDGKPHQPTFGVGHTW